MSLAKDRKENTPKPRARKEMGSGVSKQLEKQDKKSTNLSLRKRAQNRETTHSAPASTCHAALAFGIHLDLIVEREINRARQGLDRGFDRDWTAARHDTAIKYRQNITNLQSALNNEMSKHKATLEAYTNDLSKQYNELSMKDKEISRLRRTITRLEAEGSKQNTNVKHLTAELNHCKEKAALASKEIAVWEKNYKLAIYQSIEHEQTIEKLKRQLRDTDPTPAVQTREALDMEKPEHKCKIKKETI